MIDELDRGTGVGTRSQRKFPATYASNKGCTPHEIAAALYVGGPAKYAFKDDCAQISSAWIYEHVIPSIRARFPHENRLCNVLAMALLYACMEDNILVPDHIKTRVRTAYSGLDLEPTQPIEKVPLLVRRREDQLLIDEVVEIGNGGGDQQVHGDYEMFQNVFVVLNHLEQLINQIAGRSDTNFSELRAYVRQRDRIINNNIRAFGGRIEGGFQIQQANTGRRLARIDEAANANVDPAPDAANMATLSSNPRSLHELWREYEFGIDGRKPARLFTRAEKNIRSGGIKQKYYRRNTIWSTIQRMVSNGHTHQAAIARIRDVYGVGASITQIIDRIIRDKRQYRMTGGYHPNLV